MPNNSNSSSDSAADISDAIILIELLAKIKSLVTSGNFTPEQKKELAIECLSLLAQHRTMNNEEINRLTDLIERAYKEGWISDRYQGLGELPARVLSQQDAAWKRSSARSALYQTKGHS